MVDDMIFSSLCQPVVLIRRKMEICTLLGKYASNVLTFGNIYITGSTTRGRFFVGWL